jgi:hypothetical protein
MFISIVLTGITWNIDHQDKYLHSFVLPPSIERDQPANVGCYRKYGGWLKSFSVVGCRTLVDRRNYPSLPL